MTTLITILSVFILIISAVLFYIHRKRIFQQYQKSQDRKLRKWCVKQAAKARPGDSSNYPCLAEEFYLIAKGLITFHLDVLKEEVEDKST